MSTALRVENVSKQYRIYATPGDRLKESLTRGWVKRHREFWALRDISFEIESGTTTGIVGPNGSGKSTLLQIITGTLEPTHGEVWHEGRVAALLELGAGFNPEFTGIENVFMNASLMGFSKRETEDLLPEIERFAEIGQFIHQPVKTYSSGMYVRLAFSIAISASPDILIVDEALAVGDAIFQHRCMRRIKQLQESGVTIFFVSHDPGAVRALCSRAILLNAGKMEADGEPPDVLNRYQKIIMAREEAYEAGSVDRTPESEPTPELAGATEPPIDERSDASLRPVFRHGDGSAEVLSVELLNAGGHRVELIESGEPIAVRIRVRFDRDVEDPVFGFLIRNRHGIHIYGTNTDLQALRFGSASPGEVFEVTFGFEGWLAPDSYSITVASHSLDAISFDWLDSALFFRVVSGIAVEGVANLHATASTRRQTASKLADPELKIDTRIPTEIINGLGV
ncbi:MAG TPA: ABC transporter ATP-binding protein [Pyrinomonadaceae bacterium]|jgi:ABC-type polysaccharide/polyol phosphate transport system ATPase subunit